MSQTKVSKISIRPRTGTENTISTGANTMVYLDDQPIRGATFVKIEVGARKVAKVMIELFAVVDAEIYAQLEESTKRKTGFHDAKNKKPLAQFELSSYSPKRIILKDE